MPRALLLVLVVLSGCIVEDDRCGTSERQLKLYNNNGPHELSASVYVTDSTAGRQWSGWLVMSASSIGQVRAARIVDRSDAMTLVTMPVLDDAATTTIANDYVYPFSWQLQPDVTGWHVPFDEARERLGNGQIEIEIDNDTSAEPLLLRLEVLIDSDYEPANCG